MEKKWAFFKNFGLNLDLDWVLTNQDWIWIAKYDSSLSLLTGLVEIKTLCIAASHLQPGQICISHTQFNENLKQITRKVYWNTQVKPTLLQISENKFERKVNTTNIAKLDMSARGLEWQWENIIWHKDHTSYFSHIPEGPNHWSTNNMRKTRNIMNKGSLTSRSLQSILVFSKQVVIWHHSL